MEEQPSWKSHTFTLAVFAGIVVLCAIFFTLGMLVGRTQAQRIAGAAGLTGTDGAPAKAAAKEPAKEDRPELTFYDSIDKKQPPPLTASAPKPEASAPPAPAPPAAVAPSAPPIAAVGDMVNFQIEAFATSANAEKLVEKLKSEGFQAFILDPADGDKPPLYRVQVRAGLDDADQVEQKLKSAGYKAMRKK